MVDPLTQHNPSFRPEHQPAYSIDEVLAVLEQAGSPAIVVPPGQDESSQTHSTDAPEITGVALDSREVQSGDLYIGVPGAKVHGARFIETAVAAPAVAILTDADGLEILREYPSGQQLPVIVVKQVREVIGAVSALIYGTVATHGAPQIYAVTGTNGKTTTTYLLESGLSGMGLTTGLVGTIEIQVGGATVPAKFTTPEAPDLHALLASMRERDIQATAMEVSSHSLSYRRVAGVQFAVSGFTNLTQDHLDLHGSMQEYFLAKAQLFTPEYSQTSVITLNGGPQIDYGYHMAQHALAAYGDDTFGDHVITLDLGPAAVSHEIADPALTKAEIPAIWQVTDLQPRRLGSVFTLQHRDGFCLDLAVGLPGEFNVANAALAAVMLFTGYPTERWDEITNVLTETTQDQPGAFRAVRVPGRMEIVANAPTTIVDFAHNPDGLYQALEAVNQAHQIAEHPGKTILVFGATGERDTTKRAVMGDIAVRGADIVIVSDDDPHSEDPTAIRLDVMAGARQSIEEHGLDTALHEIAPRNKALAYAVELAGEHDIILAAGRGHETSQDFGTHSVELDDRVALEQALMDYGYVTIRDDSSRREQVESRNG
ncbi:Mur ligase family protein [Auritidibacter ignavus]|uniref:Mur ligase family protein n=1 Tax=Auritidibacter ignavus TaxID=678932 RepID=UPI002447C18C|nr:UDP-N-acetylmuramoyl-L-alanyl-D-glutamate--2,6-diaminopimelate ligase [Auritidibacter ignavus]WGH84611.1 UDP-N-acetylmuramoyl-L-alanyl-D-glutamate--2,6-diaminopimelate ligase [Auritidibacter ignavus]